MVYTPKFEELTETPAPLDYVPGVAASMLPSRKDMPASERVGLALAVGSGKGMTIKQIQAQHTSLTQQQIRTALDSMRRTGHVELDIAKPGKAGKWRLVNPKGEGSPTMTTQNTSEAENEAPTADDRPEPGTTVAGPVEKVGERGANGLGACLELKAGPVRFGPFRPTPIDCTAMQDASAAMVGSLGRFAHFSPGTGIVQLTPATDQDAEIDREIDGFFGSAAVPSSPYIAGDFPPDDRPIHIKTTDCTTVEIPDVTRHLREFTNRSEQDRRTHPPKLPDNRTNLDAELDRLESRLKRRPVENLERKLLTLARLGALLDPTIAAELADIAADLSGEIT